MVHPQQRVRSEFIAGPVCDDPLYCCRSLADPVAEVDTRVLPHAIQKALNNLGYPMPWDEIALELKNGQSGGAVAQHLAKDCAALKESGVKVPSPLKRGGNRNARQESLSITRLASVPFKVSKSGVNNLSQRANDKGARRNFKQNPSKSFQRDDTPPPHPRQNGQYKLARVPVPRMTPAFRQRELDPHPPLSSSLPLQRLMALHLHLVPVVLPPQRSTVPNLILPRGLPQRRSLICLTRRLCKKTLTVLTLGLDKRSPILLRLRQPKESQIMSPYTRRTTFRRLSASTSHRRFRLITKNNSNFPTLSPQAISQ